MIKNLDFTFIGKNTNLKGDFHFEAPTKIAGLIVGNIYMYKESTLTLEIGSIVNGSIKCHDLEVYGHFIGDIEATGTIVVYPTGDIEGKLKASSIEVLPGANLNITGHTI